MRVETDVSFHPRVRLNVLVENDDLPRTTVENSRTSRCQLLIHALATTDTRGHLKFDSPNAHVRCWTSDFGYDSYCTGVK